MADPDSSHQHDSTQHDVHRRAYAPAPAVSADTGPTGFVCDSCSHADHTRCSRNCDCQHQPRQPRTLTAPHANSHPW